MYIKPVITIINKHVEKNDICIRSLSTILAIHTIALFGFYIIENIKYQTVLYQFIIHLLSMISITGGYHRLWSHRSYCAKFPLQIFYIIFGTTASQSSVIWWAKNHRTHHRCEESKGDPYNIKKGLYHSHIGWIYKNKDKYELMENNKSDVSDLFENNIVAFQHNYFIFLWVFFNLFCNLFILSLWNETLLNSIFSSFIRITVTQHTTYCVNSFAHYFGNKPHRKDLFAANNKYISFLTFGEGWHNYHHSYPKDYRASKKILFNFTTMFIDFTKRIGLSYNHYAKGCEEISIENRFNKSYYDLLDT